ncbi:MAG TPA: hypothetical protein VGL61_22820 [Kofleriaceae bacterium]
MRYALVGLAVMACGRLGFNAEPGSGPADASRDAAIDASGPPVAPQFVQYADTVNMLSDGLATSYTMDVTAGDLLVVCVGINGQLLVTLTDATGDAFTTLGPLLQDGQAMYTAYAIAATSGPESVGVTFDGSAYGALHLHEYADVDLVAPLDTNAANTGSSVGSDVIEVSLTTATANELLFVYAVSTDGAATAGTGFNPRSSIAADISEDRIEAAPGAYEATASNSGTPWEIQALAFRGHD